MENKIENKKFLYYGMGLVVLVVLTIIFWSINRNKGAALVGNLDSKTDQMITVPSIENKTIKRIGFHGNKIKPLSYEEALLKYKDNRIQLDKGCQAIPNTITYKNGTSIMIDNRTSADRIVKVGSSYPIKGYDFKIIKLSSETLPMTWLVDCDNSQNVASILIQK